MVQTINPEAYYAPKDEVFRPFATVATLKRWRCKGVGPAYIKTRNGRAGKVVYRGQDILDWIEARRRQPEAA